MKASDYEPAHRPDHLLLDVFQVVESGVILDKRLLCERQPIQGYGRKGDRSKECP